MATRGFVLRSLTDFKSSLAFCLIAAFIFFLRELVYMRMAVMAVNGAWASHFHIGPNKEQGENDIAYTAGHPYSYEQYAENSCQYERCDIVLDVH